MTSKQIERLKAWHKEFYNNYTYYEIESAFNLLSAVFGADIDCDIDRAKMDGKKADRYLMTRIFYENELISEIKE